jgi:hypothetical protein
VIPRPGPGEFAPFYAPYLATMGEVDLERELGTQMEALSEILGELEGDGRFRYAPGKWSVSEVVGHLADSERVFAYRLLRVARGDETPLPGFDENRYVEAAAFDTRPLAELVGDLAAVRACTMRLVESIAPEQWSRRGRANGVPVSARAIAWILAGHTRHHLEVLRTRYLQPTG